MSFTSLASLCILTLCAAQLWNYGLPYMTCLAALWGKLRCVEENGNLLNTSIICYSWSDLMILFKCNNNL